MSSPPLIGHESVLERFRNALGRGRLGHAFLFVGPEGVGKRRVARHLAEGLLCETHPPEAIDPCGQCAACQQFMAGAHPDFFEVAKPADKNELPIEEMRTLGKSLALKPMRGGRKIAVIDDADALNEEAANSFLKTLEEPAPHSVLILIGATLERQLPTIRSRCQIVRFDPLTPAQVAVVLQTLLPTSSQADRQAWADVSEGSVARALEEADPAWREIRDRLWAGLSSERLDAVRVSAALQAFVEEQGKESAVKRAAARRLIRAAVDLFRWALRRQQAPGLAGANANADALARRLDADILLDLIERCLAADYHVARMLHQSLALECWLDDLAQIGTGAYVRPIRSVAGEA